MASVKRVHIYYSGSVQGVGFRFAAERFALSLGINGWAKNLADGRVEVLCEGSAEEIGRFLQEINRVFKEHVENTEIEWGEPTGEFDTFEIRF